MKRLIVSALMLSLLTIAGESRGGRGRAGGGARPAAGAVHSYGAGGGAAVRTTTPVVGPRGGVGQAGTGGGSYTTKGGSTVDYKGAAVGGPGPGGVQGGKYVGGIQVTTPGGKEVTRVGAGGGAVGPGGNAIAGKSNVTVGSGPGGSFATASKGGVAIGPHGAVGGATKVGGVTTPGGTVVGGARTGVAVGPYGAAVGRTTIGTTTQGTRASCN